MTVFSCDLDGCVVDFNHRAVEKFGKCDESLYSLEERWPDKVEAIHKFVHNPHNYLDLELIPGAKHGIQALHKAGIKIHICTSRPIPESFTARWLNSATTPSKSKVKTVIYRAPFVEPLQASMGKSC